MKINIAEKYEPVTVRLTKEKTPIAFENKVQELIEECGMEREEAENEAEGCEIELEIYYEKGYGLFAIESGAAESSTELFSPYTRERMESPDED